MQAHLVDAQAGEGDEGGAGRQIYFLQNSVSQVGSSYGRFGLSQMFCTSSFM